MFSLFPRLRLSKYGEGMMYWTEIRSRGSLKNLWWSGGFQTNILGKTHLRSLQPSYISFGVWYLRVFSSYFNVVGLKHWGKRSGIPPRRLGNGLRKWIRMKHLPVILPLMFLLWIGDSWTRARMVKRFNQAAITIGVHCCVELCTHVKESSMSKIKIPKQLPQNHTVLCQVFWPIRRSPRRRPRLSKWSRMTWKRSWTNLPFPRLKVI